jgi:hypothetical protein
VDDPSNIANKTIEAGVSHLFFEGALTTVKSGVGRLRHNKSSSRFTEARIWLDHREPSRKDWYERAFDASRYPTSEFLYVTIMSKGTLPFVRRALSNKATRPKNMRVLTWDPFE